MGKRVSTILVSGALALALAAAGCGGGAQVDSKGTGSSAETVTGVASTGTPAAGTVSLKDSSTPAQERTATTSGSGAYSINTAGMTAPYMLKAEWQTANGDGPLYSLAEGNGRSNVNAITHAAVVAASEDDAEGLYQSPSRERRDSSRIRFRDIIEQLRVVLAPLFALYESTGDPVRDDDDDDEDDDNEDDNTGLQALLRDVSIRVHDRMVTVKNRSTGGLIYEAPLNDIDSGTFHPENMPGSTTPPSETCAYTYSSWNACGPNNTQSRTVLSSTPAGCTGTPVLTQACTYAPPACTYNYSAWGACQPNNTQTRTMLSSSPAGCSGTPELTQACTYTPPTPGACTSFTYSAWGACQSNNTQTRTVTSSSPAGCSGGSPVLTQACTYTPPACTSFTYSAWGACQSNNTQTRTVTSSSPAGCSGGSPVLTQACTYIPPTPTCGSCHAIPPSTGQHSFHASRMSCASCHGSGYSSTTVNAATHANGARDVMASLNWNASAQTCAPACHGSRGW